MKMCTKMELIEERCVQKWNAVRKDTDENGAF